MLRLMMGSFHEGKIARWAMLIGHLAMAPTFASRLMRQLNEFNQWNILAMMHNIS